MITSFVSNFQTHNSPSFFFSLFISLERGCSFFNIIFANISLNNELHPLHYEPTLNAVFLCKVGGNMHHNEIIRIKYGPSILCPMFYAKRKFIIKFGIQKQLRLFASKTHIEITPGVKLRNLHKLDRDDTPGLFHAKLRQWCTQTCVVVCHSPMFLPILASPTKLNKMPINK